MDRIKPKIRLQTDVTIRTFMIATIQMLEDTFGEQWGHGRHEDELTDEEYELWEKFLEIRERILDMGNDLIKTKKNITQRKKIYG